MILAIDTYYWEDKAKTVGIGFETWGNEEVLLIQESFEEKAAPYVPGEFYKRELPCIMGLLDLVDSSSLSTLIIDGYVILNDEGKWGLGGYLYHELGQAIPIIGVAKRNFHSNTLHVREVVRGASKNPLYVSSMGMDLDEAAAHIQQMDGPFRMPDLLKLVDTKTKEENSSSNSNSDSC